MKVETPGAVTQCTMYMVQMSVNSPVNPAYLVSGCQGRQQTFVLLLLCCGHDDKVVFVVKCTCGRLKYIKKNPVLRSLHHCV